MLSIAYITNRLDNRAQWFFDSLWNQWSEDRIPIKLIVIDFYALTGGRKEEVAEKSKRFTDAGIELAHVPPKPTVWQGPHRKTSRDYFAAANARNTAICLAPDGHLAFVDDLSVLMPGWLDRVKAAMAGGYVGLGTYAKVKDLIVKDGSVVTCTEDPEGGDHRIVVARKMHANTAMPALIPCGGSWFFGCSLVAPVQAFLDINGLDEDCDSCGAEDYPCGYMIQNAGYKLMLDPAMKTLESWELHFVEKPFLRIDKPNVKGQRDGSNAYLKMLLGGRNRAPNYFGEGGIAALRQSVLDGNPFPIGGVPEHDWRDGQPLIEM